MSPVRKCNLKECQPVRIISWRSNLKKTMGKGSCWPLPFSFHILSLFPTPSSSSSSYFPSSFLLNHPKQLLQSSYYLIIMFFTALWHSTFSISLPEYFITSMLPHCSVPSTHIMWLPCITENETACLITEIISEYTGTWVVNNSQKRQRRFQVPGQGKGRELPLGRWQLYPGQKGSLVSLIIDLEFLLRATEYIRALPRVMVGIP